jgi:hypothetical protein
MRQGGKLKLQNIRAAWFRGLWSVVLILPHREVTGRE